MDAFRELYERYYRDVYRFALFLTGDAARADDLTADTFVRAWAFRPVSLVLSAVFGAIALGSMITWIGARIRSA